MYIATLASKLCALDINIIRIKKIDYGQQICLACGAVVNIYDKGTVLVQGKMHENDGEGTIMLLKRILPPDTRWCVKQQTRDNRARELPIVTLRPLPRLPATR